MKRTCACLLAIAVVAGYSTGRAEEWGSLTGRFLYDGDAPKPKAIDNEKAKQDFPNEKLVEQDLVVDPESHGLANVLVYVRTKGVKIKPGLEEQLAKEALMDNKGGRFQPRILPLWLGVQTLVLGNSDPVGHNSNFQPLGDIGVNPLLAPGSMVKHALRREQSVPQPVSCNIHNWMRAYVLPRKNPYTDVSDADGTFTIADLPTGELEFQAWHENPGYLEVKGWKKGRFKLTIKPGENSLGDIQVPASAVKKKS